MASLQEQQRKIEEEAAISGVRRFRSTLVKARDGEREDTTQVGAAMVKRIVGPMVELLCRDLGQRARGGASNGGSGLNPLRKLDPELVCAVATRAALRQMSRTVTRATIARRIGEALEDQLIWERWRKLNRTQAEAVQRRVNQSPSARQKRASTRGFARRWEQRALEDAWTTYRLLGIGLKFIEYLERLDVFEPAKVSSRYTSKKFKPAHAVQLTPTAAQFAADLADFLATARPLNSPLVIPPVPWTGTVGGGFHYREQLDSPLIPQALKPLPLVRRACKEQKAMLAKADLSTVYAGLNAAQATAWRINPKVYSVFRKLIEAGTGPDITSYDPKPEPGRLSDDEAKDPEKLRAHKNEKRLAKLHNVKMKSKRLAQFRTLKVAETFATTPQIFFAYNLDSRGRVYACSDDLSPQGNDVQHGLLEFSEGDAMTAEGMTWLRIHIANTFGNDKVSFEEREKWTLLKETMIAAVAAHPLDCTEWYKADQPWQFLAGCFAYADQLENPGAPCRVPVMLDGTCSGIQHWAGLLRDEGVGAAVNLVPADKPADLYANVAVKVMENFNTSTDEYALEWRSFGIDRKIVKRSVMVLPYGGTFRSTLDFVREAVSDRLDRDGYPRWLDEQNEHKATKVLAQATWRAMKEVVKGPLEGMKWVKRVATTWGAQRGKVKFHWIAPCGLPVVMDPRKKTGQRGVRGVLPSGEKIEVKYQEDTNASDWSRVASAAPPNFIQSLDASHLLLSLERAKAEGIDKIAIVHDAFGTTPSKIDAFSRVLRDEFAKLYVRSPFDRLRDAAINAGVTCPAYPAEGHLKVADIADSKYLFA